MLKIVCALAFIVCCQAVESEPSQTESGFFMPPALSGPQFIIQEQMSRKFADIFLGLHISSQFQQMGMIDFHKGQLITKAEEAGVAAVDLPADSDYVVEDEVAPVADDDEVIDDDEGDVVDDDEVVDEDSAAEEPIAENKLEEDDDDEADDDDLSMIQLKEEFFPYMGYGYGAGNANPYTGMYGYAAENQKDESIAELEHHSSVAKMGALKAMHLQFYLAAGDVEKAYWVNRIIMTILPPQLSVFKLYKTYLNTIALSLAYQFHDSFTFEAYVDDFNDRYGAVTGRSSALTEALAEQALHSHWSSLATIKWALFYLTMIEKMYFGQFLNMAQPQQQQAYQAASFLEVDSSSSFFAPGGGNAVGYYYMYLQYFQWWMRFSSISIEMQLAQAGMMAASVKAHNLLSDSPVSSEMTKMSTHLERQWLPMLYSQWGSVNQMKYFLELYGYMLDMYLPQMVAAQATDRAENVFQNMVQTEEPVTSAPAPANTQ